MPMSILVPGYPSTNPLLSSIAAIENGGDLEAALLYRDISLVTPKEFLQAAWEALGWFDPHARTQADGLIMQALASWNVMDEETAASVWPVMTSEVPRTLFQAELLARMEVYH